MSGELAFYPSCPVPIRPLDVVRDMAIVGDTFHNSLRDGWPWCLVSAKRLLADLRLFLTDPRAKAMVADVPDGRIAGWALTVPHRNEVVFTYVRYSYRRMGIGSALIRACGIDARKPIPVRFWTRAAERISRHPRWAGLYSTVIDNDEQEDRNR